MDTISIGAERTSHRLLKILSKWQIYNFKLRSLIICCVTAVDPHTQLSIKVE